MSGETLFPAQGGIEPTIRELFADDIMALLLKRDGLNAADVLAKIRYWQRIRRRPETVGEAA